jgi:hypothetical protein
MHIKAKRRQLELKVRNMNWLINTKSQLSIENKITIYKAIIKPVLDLWDRAVGMQQTFYHKNSPNVSIQTVKKTS